MAEKKSAKILILIIWIVLLTAASRAAFAGAYREAYQDLPQVIMQEVMEATQPELAAPISTQDAAASAGAMADSSPAKEMPVMILCDCADYNQVDNDWFEVFTVKSQRLSSGDKVRIVPEESFYLFTAFVEMDTYPDVGYHWTLVIITPEDYERGFVAEQEISVTENHGRYTGNTVF